MGPKSITSNIGMGPKSITSNIGMGPKSITSNIGMGPKSITSHLCNGAQVYHIPPIVSILVTPHFSQIVSKEEKRLEINTKDSSGVSDADNWVKPFRSRKK